MKIGLVSAILEDYDFKKMIDTVSEIGYECVEVACWPKAKAERRYAGVSHIDVTNLGDKDSRRKSGTGKRNLDSNRSLCRRKESTHCNRKLPDAF